MALTTGTRLGVYEVTAPIGEGGMGAVYRATDTSLGRQVAIKVLPDAFAQDAERLARFEREAKTLAALNHPHIAAIYAIEKSSGQHALVMELVEGEDLSERIARGALPVDEALSIARQIAEALEAAHEQGIIHRDLKPANIKLRADGTVKVLDFGLAKLAGPAAFDSAQAREAGPYTPSNLSLSPTITSPAMMTGAGIILGTAAYMAPEQARGKSVDKRADIWAFGCVLFEMLTGTRAFEGEDIADTLGNVMKVEPNWQRVPASVPPRVDRVLRSCLQKKAAQRLDSAQAVRLVLDGAFDTVDSHAGNEASQPAPPATRPLWRRALPLAAALLLGALAAGAAAWRLKPEPARGVARFAVLLPDGQDFTYTGRPLVALSPDGSTLVYVADNRLYVRPISGLDARPLSGSETRLGVAGPVISPDGRSVAFWAAIDGTLKRLDLSGGAPVTITPAAVAPLGMSWGNEGLVFSDPDKGILRVSPDGGVPEVIVPPSPDEMLAHPQILPGGKAVLLSVKPTAEAWEKGTVVVQPLGGGARQTVVAAGSHGRYIPTGHLVYAVNGVLMAVPFDADSLSVSGGSVPIVEGVRRNGLGSGANAGAAHFAMSATGTLAFLPGPAMLGAGTGGLGLVDRKGQVQPLGVLPGNYAAPRVSRDGMFVAFEVDDGKEPSVWIYELSGRTAMRRLTFGGRNRAPVWSPDGGWVLFQSDREGDLALFRQRADGTGAAERVTRPEAAEEHIPQSVSPDGKHLLFTVRKERTHTLWTTQVPGASGTKPEPFGGVRSEHGLVEGVFSPDGRWVAYHEPEPGNTSQAFLQPFPATGAKYLVRAGGGPYWSPKGDQLILNTGPSQSMIVPVTTAPAVAFGQAVNFPRAGRSEPSPRISRRNVDSHPDGEHIVGVTNETAGQGTSRQITVVLNWFDELRARVPVP